MENKDQITALAREYAEEKYPYLSNKIISLRTQEIKNAEQLIRFLLRRYCLVEKSKVVAEYRNVAEAVDAKRKWNLTLSEDKLAKADLLFDLFPDLGKEVEE